MKRKFYIIGHNPNTIELATRFLENGANAIEPDICFHPEIQGDLIDKFFVYDKDDPRDSPPFVNLKHRKLKDYLSGLTKVLQSNPSFNLVLIAFDLKPPFHKDDTTSAYDINTFFDMVRDNFSKNFDPIAILATVGHVDGMDFLQKVKLQANEAVGVDDNAAPDEVNDFFHPLHLRCTYANGTSAPFASTISKTHLQKISEAVQMRDAENSFSMVYVWTVTSEHSMRTYLDLNVDGLLTDADKVSKLADLINNDYAEKFELAVKGDSPFTGS